jgi:hypothetical protein
MTMGFIKEQNRTNEKLQIPADFRHCLILGETGSGKTASIINPLIIDRIQRGHGLIIFDFKGNYHYTVKALVKRFNKLENVIELGRDYGTYINILQDIPVESLDKIFRPLLGHSKDDKFWQESAIQLAISILGIIKYIKKLEPDFEYDYNFKSLIEIASEAKNIDEFKKNVISKINKIFNKSKDYSKNLNIIITILKYYKILDKIADDFSLEKMTEENEKTVLFSVIASLINPIAELIKDIVNINEIDLLKELSNQKIIIISLDDFEENALNAIVSSIMLKIKLFKMNYPDFPLSIVIDEAQKVLNDDFSLPLDIFREFKTEIILSTQSIANLKAKLKHEKVESYIANLVYKIYLNGQDKELPKFTAYYNDKYYKLTPIEINKKEKFLAELEYQKNFSKLKDLSFKYKGKNIIYSKLSETELFIRDENLKNIDKTDFILKKYTKKELREMFSNLLYVPDIPSLKGLEAYEDLMSY